MSGVRGYGLFGLIIAGLDPAIYLLCETMDARVKSAHDGARLMLDIKAKADRSGIAGGGPPLDFQAHLAALEAQGLLVRVDRPIDKDSELHPLVRWQFQGGLAEEQRRAFLFT